MALGSAGIQSKTTILPIVLELGSADCRVTRDEAIRTEFLSLEAILQP
jgi:hypothetical protein